MFSTKEAIFIDKIHENLNYLMIAFRLTYQKLTKDNTKLDPLKINSKDNYINFRYDVSKVLFILRLSGTNS